MAKHPKSPLEADLLMIDRPVAVDYVHADDLDGAAGDAQWSEARVRIAIGLKHQIERHVVMHEVLHIIDDTFGIGLKENQVQALATPLARLIADNPHLVAYLANKDTPA
jgi:hypothetical protein